MQWNGEGGYRSVCYAFMQATGLVNDHVSTFFRYRELSPRRKR
jgi:3-methyladenine DNA glycosylase Tag